MNDYMTKPLASDLLQSMITRYALPARHRRASGGVSASMPSIVSSTVRVSGAADHEDDRTPRAYEVATDAAQPPVLDPQRVQVLADLAQLRLDAFGPVITLYERNVVDKLAVLRGAVASRDLEALGAAAHALKGSALNVGANRVVVLARALEQIAADGDERAFNVDCEEITLAFEQSVQALRERARDSTPVRAPEAADHP